MSPVFAETLDEVITQVSRDYSINEAVIYKIIEAESNFDPQAVSYCNARGLMQVTHNTWDWICREYLHVAWDFDDSAFDPEKNIRVGTRFLKWIADYLDDHTGQLNDSKERLLLACYNAGPGAVRNYGFRIPPYEETQRYVQKISEPAQ
ncbi:MAG: lytic transglycosylase domain-containing protein [Candidatus Omnitrophica bacterium]|nr:lytic transglycosylase domain-containing protein [Candidatus Omnitrophota bacterium]